MKPVPLAPTQTVSLVLYLHEEREAALLLSPYGRRRDARWLPRSLIGEPRALKLTSPKGEACHEGAFELPLWKARELGWLDAAGEEQLELI